MRPLLSQTFKSGQPLSDKFKQTMCYMLPSDSPYLESFYSRKCTLVINTPVQTDCRFSVEKFLRHYGILSNQHQQLTMRKLGKSTEMTCRVDATVMLREIVDEDTNKCRRELANSTIQIVDDPIGRLQLDCLLELAQMRANLRQSIELPFLGKSGSYISHEFTKKTIAEDNQALASTDQIIIHKGGQGLIDRKLVMGNRPETRKVGSRFGPEMPIIKR